MNIISKIKNYTEFILFIILKTILPRAKSKTNSLLLINTGEIGDLVVSSVLLENPNIFNSYDEVKFLIKEEYLELFKDYSGNVGFIGYNYKKYKFWIIYKLKILSEFRMEGFETCINLTAARGILNEELTFLTGAKETIVLNSNSMYLGDRLGKYFNKMYGNIIAGNRQNEYAKHFELMKYLSGKDDEKIVLNNGITFNEELVISNSVIDDFSNSIVIAPFSAKMNRDWRKEYFKEIIISLKKGYKIVLLGTAAQKNDLLKLPNDDSNIKIFAGVLRLNEIPSLMKRTKLFIGLDSGITHIALKIGIPLIAIIGGGQYGRFFPYMENNNHKYLFHNLDCFGCEWNCSLPEMECLTKVKPEQVIEVAEKILQRSELKAGNCDAE